MSSSSLTANRRIDRSVAMIAVGVTLAVLLVAGTAVAAAVYKYQSGGAVKAVRTAITTGDSYFATTGLFTAIPGAGVNIPVPGGQKAILIITFSAEFLCLTPNGTCSVTAYVDGATAPPHEVTIETPSGTPRTFSFQWVSGTLNPGQHSVTMAAKQEGSAGLTIFKRTLTVLRVKT